MMNVEECKDRMTFAAVYQEFPDDVLLMLAEKNLTKAALQTMHVGV